MSKLLPFFFDGSPKYLFKNCFKTHVRLVSNYFKNNNNSKTTKELLQNNSQTFSGLGTPTLIQSLGIFHYFETSSEENS